MSYIPHILSILAGCIMAIFMIGVGAVGLVDEYRNRHPQVERLFSGDTGDLPSDKLSFLVKGRLEIIRGDWSMDWSGGAIRMERSMSRGSEAPK